MMNRRYGTGRRSSTEGQDDLRFVESLPIDCDLESIDLDRVRRRFSELFDRIALAVHRAGYDLDDTIVERYWVCEGPGGEIKDVPAQMLTDRARAIQQLRQAFQRVDDGVRDVNRLRIVGLRITADVDDRLNTPLHNP